MAGGMTQLVAAMLESKHRTEALEAQKDQQAFGYTAIDSKQERATVR